MESAGAVVREVSTGTCWRDDILVLRGSFGTGAVVRVALAFFECTVFETVASGVLASCDGTEDGVVAGLTIGPGPSLGMTGVVDIVVEDFEVGFGFLVARGISR